MSIHGELSALSAEAIEEYLKASELCLEYKKADGGCLGYPATLLLFCVVDALGGFIALDQGSKIRRNEPFMVLNHPCFGLKLAVKQIKRLEWWYRNGLAHNAVLPPGTCLTVEDGEPFDFAANGDPVKIRVFSFQRLVNTAWKQFDKKLLVPSRVLDTRKMPTIGFESLGSIASPIASSGSPLIPKVRKM